ncbi:MAG: cache domain-containing protein [Bacteroidales bacterium]
MNSREMRKFFLSIVLPSILAIALFIISFYLLVIPSFEKNMLNARKEMISELTSTAWSLVNDYYGQYSSGNLTLEEAKSQAASRIEQMRYGDEKKDYFWITDSQPLMIMHPYRRDLNGTDLSGYSDPDGKGCSWMLLLWLRRMVRVT